MAEHDELFLSSERMAEHDELLLSSEHMAETYDSPGLKKNNDFGLGLFYRC